MDVDKKTPPESPDLADHVAESVGHVVAFHQDHYERASRPQRGFDALVDRLGRPGSVLVLILALGAWVGFAASVTGGAVDQPVFAWLELAATLLALVIALLILVTQRRETILAERRAQLMLELSLLADRKTAKLIELIEELRRDEPGVADRVDIESEEMARPADPQAVVSALDQANLGKTSGD